jgi:diguanylate cyclase (GGDEF)-like protein
MLEEGQDLASDDAISSRRTQSLRRTPAPVSDIIRSSSGARGRDSRKVPSDVPLRSSARHLALDGADLEALIELARAAGVGQARHQAARLRALLGADAERLEDLIEALSERARDHARLQRLAGTDGLTRIANRRGFAESLRRELARARRHGGTLGLLMLDVDGMKLINDGPGGHAAGDRALRTIARCMRQVVRQSDLIARIGGDEFAVILPATDFRTAQAIAERIRREVTRVSEGELGVSLGVALTGPGDGATALLAAADAALYRDKTQRKITGRSTPVPADRAAVPVS